MRVLLVAIVWVGDFILARFLLKGASVGSAAAILYALLPIPAFLAFVWVVIGQIRRLDEMHRRIHLEALAIAFPLTIAGLMVLGLLDLAVTLPQDDLGYRHLWPFPILFYYIGLAFSKRRYA